MLGPYLHAGVASAAATTAHPADPFSASVPASFESRRDLLSTTPTPVRTANARTSAIARWICSRFSKCSNLLQQNNHPALSYFRLNLTGIVLDSIAKSNTVYNTGILSPHSTVLQGGDGGRQYPCRAGAGPVDAKRYRCGCSLRPPN